MVCFDCRNRFEVADYLQASLKSLKSFLNQVFPIIFFIATFITVLLLSLLSTCHSVNLLCNNWLIFSLFPWVFLFLFLVCLLLIVTFIFWIWVVQRLYISEFVSIEFTKSSNAVPQFKVERSKKWCIVILAVSTQLNERIYYFVCSCCMFVA